MTESSQSSLEQDEQIVGTIIDNHPSVQASTVRHERSAPDVTNEIIWTPGFIMLFVLVLIVGLSATSLFTQGWSNGYFSRVHLFLGFTVIVLGAWIVLVLKAHSLWVRVGGLFGIAWALLEIVTLLAPHFTFGDAALKQGHIDAAAQIALLGAYLGLSIRSLHFDWWDKWFFRLIPIAVCGFIAIKFLRLPPGSHTFSQLETIIARIVVYLSIAIWWLRPSCWKTQPGPTLLFGLIPLIYREIGIPGLALPDAYIFYSQVALLIMFLALLRVCQRERAIRQVTYRNKQTPATAGTQIS